MRKTIFATFILIFVILIHLSFKTNSPFTLIKSTDITGDYITTDNLGNVYLVNDNKLWMYDDSGNLLYTYSSLIDGNINGLDVSNPLKILVFYKDFGRIKYLDNKLSVKGDYIALQDLSLEQASTACSSYENSFWVYDPLSIKLVRIDQNLQVNQISGNVSQLTGLTFSPTYMAEFNNALYISDTLNGILIFDRYGGYIKALPIKNIHFFQIINNKLAYYESGSIITVDLKTYEETKTEIPDKIALCTRIEQNKLYVLTSKKLNIYRFN